MDLRAPCTRTGSAHLTRPEGRDLSLSLENRLLRPGACATSWTGTPLCFSQPLNPKLPSTLCSLTSPPLTLIRPLTSPFLKTESEKPSPMPEYLRQQEAGIEDSINKEQQVLEDPAEESELLPSYNLSAQEYEDLEQARGALVDEELRDVPDPSQNQDAGLQEKKEALLNGVCCSLIQGGKFTDADNATRQDLLALCQAVAEQEPEFVLKVALYTRQELNIRSTANFLLALGAWLPPCRPHLRRYFCRTVRLPSDWIEVAKIYQSLAESSRKIAPYPSCLRRSLADSFKLFDEYQLAKYNTRKQRCKSDPRKQRRIQKPPSDLLIAKWSKCLSLAKADVTQLVAESTPVQKERKPKDHFSLKKLVRWLHIKEPTYNIMCLLGRRYPSDLQSFARSRLPGPWDSRRAGKRMKFQVPETWDRQLSLRGNNVKVWEELIDNQNLPFMAMLRNLRNVIVAGISSQHHKQILEKLTNRKSVIHSRQFPFRFLAAYKVLDELQQRLEEKDEPLPTREALTQEAMGSVKLPPRRSWLLRDRASVLAAQKRVQGISFIHWWVTKRLEQLRKIRDVRYDQDLLDKYRAALSKAVEISASHNVPPLPNHTVILCSVDFNMSGPCISAKGLHVPNTQVEDESQDKARSPQMLEVAVLLALMARHVSEHSRLILYNSNTYCEVEVKLGSILGNVDRLLKEAKRLQDAEVCDFGRVPGMSAFLMDCVQNHVQIDTIFHLSDYYIYNCTDVLQLYRYHVNLDMLYVHVSLSAMKSSIQSGVTGCKNDIFLCGSSDQILRFVCERGSTRLMEHVERIDEIFRLPRSWQGGRSPKAVEPTALGPLLLTPKLRWRTVRVFVSSTFRDMRSERDLLVRSVFPELRARAARHFVRVQEVDLRWGITEEESRGNRQLELCLSEIARCQLFVGILGERYGQMLRDYPLPNLPQFEWVKSYPECRSITELEIMQFLRLNDDSSNQRSFFCTRDSAVLRSLPEEWVADFAAESEEAKTRVADLKSHVKEAGLLVLENYQSEWGGEVNGKPYLKGLEEFGISVLNTLWKAIVSQYCQADCDATAEGSVADDALQEAFLEEQSGQRYGRLKQLAATVSAIRERREGGLFVVHGRPSEGKTAFVASLASQLALRDSGKRPGPTDLLFHFTAASESAQDGASMLRRLCVILSDRLKEQQEIPQSYRGLVLVFHSLLARFAHSQPRRHLILIIDGADCVHTGNDQRTSDWIPEHVPRRVTLVLSVTAESPLHSALARRKETIKVHLGPLEPLDRSEIVRRSLAVYGKKLEESAFNNQMRQLVMKKESHSPLFLKLASEELREFGIFEKVSDQIRALPATLSLLIQHALGCLEEEHGVEMVTFALSALSASVKGLRERDLYTILCVRRGLRAGAPPLSWEEVMEETLKPSQPVPMATFVRLMRSLRCIMGVWAPAETSSSRLRLSNALLRVAVQHRYLRDSSREKQVHLFLAVHLWRLTDPDENRRFTDCDPETLGDLPHHLILSGEVSRLGSLLTNLRFSALHLRLGLLPQLVAAFNLYHTATSSGTGSQLLLPEIGPYRDFITTNLPVLSRDPILFWQQALNQSDSSPVCAQARRLLADGGRPLPEKAPEGFRLVQWTNKPQALARTEGKLMTTPTLPLCVSISPSGRLAVVGTGEGIVHVLDLESGQELRSLASSCDGISGCTFLGEGALCVTSFDGKIEAWSLADGCRLLLIDGHTDRITGCALSPDGKHLATCSWDRALKVWAVTPGKLNVALVNPHPLGCVTFHPEGQLLAAGSWDRTVRIWNWVTASVVMVLHGHRASVRAVAYAPSGDYLASASLLGDVRLWSATSGSAAGSYQAHRGPVTDLRYLAGGKYLLSTGEDHQVRIWSGNLGQRCGEYSPKDPSPALCVSVTQSGALMAVGYHSNQPKIFHLETGALAAECEDLKVPVRCLQWLHGEEFLASGSDDNILRVWHVQDSRASCARHCRGHTRPLLSLSRSEQFLASASADFTILLWTLAELIDRDGCAEVSPACVLRGHSDSVTCSSFSPDGLQLVTGSKDKSLLFWDLVDRPARISHSLLSCHWDWITGCSWASRYVASCSNDGTVCLWDPKSGDCIQQLKCPSVSNVCVMADLLISVTEDGDLFVWKDSGTAVTRVHAHSQRINHLAAFKKAVSTMEAEGTETGDQLELLTVTTASEDGTVRLWHPLLAGEVATLTGHSAAVSAAATADGSPFFLTVAADRTVRLWELPRHQDVKHPACHRGAVTALCWSPSGEFLVSGSRSGEVMVWRSGMALHTIQAHTNQISGVAFFSKDGFAVGSFDKRVSIWTLRAHQHSVRMHLQSTFSLDFPVYYMSMLRMQERLLVGDLKGNLVAWSPEEGRRTLLDSDYLCYLFSRVIERRDGSLLAVDGPRRTSLLVLEKKIKSSSSEQERNWEASDSESERESEKPNVEPIPGAEPEQKKESEKQDADTESERRDTDPEQDAESERRDTDAEQDAESEKRDTDAETEKRDTDPEQDAESEKRDTDPEQDTESEKRDTDAETEKRDTDAESEKRDTDPEQDTETEKRDTDPEQDAESEKRDTDAEQDEELLQVNDTYQVTPWGLYSPETSDTFLWLTVVKESDTMSGGAHSMLCADSRGSLWCSVWDPTVPPTDETSEQRNQELTTWTHKQVHSDRVTAVSDTEDLIVTASYDRTVRLWDRASLKQVGLFTCQAPVLCLEVNPVNPWMGVCGDSSGNIYFLNWDSFPSDD